MHLMDLIGVNHTYGTKDEVVHALKQLTLQIDAGEKIAIVGHSGSGKSTLASILSCILTPTGGTYRINGHNTNLLTQNELTAIRAKQFGIVFQNYCLIKRLKVYENVMFPLLYDNNVSPKEMLRRTEEVLHALGLENLANKKPYQLSGGQQQLVAIARAVVKAPPIIIADEPTANLDIENERRILSCLNELNSNGTTLITITHSSAVAAQYPRILHMKNGVVTEEVREL